MSSTEISFTKGGIIVVVYAVEVDDALSKKATVITPTQSSSNQSQGPKDPKIVDLLRVTRTIVITGEITGKSIDKGQDEDKTATEVKQDLMKIYLGGGINGGLTTLNYEGLGRSLTDDESATSIKGIIEKVAFNEKPTDEPSKMNNPSTSADYANFSNVSKYTVQITFLEGVLV